MSAHQIGVNAAAARRLAEILEGWGLSDTTRRAEWVVTELLAQGVAPVPPTPPLRGPGSTTSAQQQAMAEIRAVFDRRRPPTTEGSPS